MYYKLTGESWNFFIYSRNAARKTNVLTAWEAWLYRVEAVAFVNRLWLAYRRPPRKDHHRLSHKGHLNLPRKGTVVMLRTVQFVNRLRPQNQWPVHQWVYSSYCTNCHIHALFVNEHRPHFEIWPRSKSLAKLESLAWRVLQVTQVPTPPLTSAYPGQAQSYLILIEFSIINCPYTCVHVYAVNVVCEPVHLHAWPI